MLLEKRLKKKKKGEKEETRVPGPMGQMPPAARGADALLRGRGCGMGQGWGPAGAQQGCWNGLRNAEQMPSQPVEKSLWVIKPAPTSREMKFPCFE